MTIHPEHPFLPPEEERDQARRLRSRLGGAVTLWASGSGDGPRQRAGLTVSSQLVANGEPGHLLALLDPDSDLFAMLTDTGAAAVTVLGGAERQLADAFAGVAPAPGGPFRTGQFTATEWGPRLAGERTWAGVRLTADPREVGWSMLVDCAIERLEFGPDQTLVHRRGRYSSDG